MEAIFTEKHFTQYPAELKKINLPFNYVTARGLIVQRKTGAILGTKHKNAKKYALPGGAIENNETAYEAVLRELREESIKLIGSDDQWKKRISVDYYSGYEEFSVWFVFLVDDVEIGECDENEITRWIHKDEDIWHPHMKEKILISIQIYLSTLS
jgi:8-oxo-dGTP pyrophosphatase MutT (NUDIX family)